MKALHFFQHGGIENLRYGDIPDPTLTADEVIIRVKACALNRLDLWVLFGWPGLQLDMPHVGGADIAGVVEHVGTNVKHIKPGARVVVNPGYLLGEDEWTRRGEESISPLYRIVGEGRRGGFAEYVSVPASSVYEFPEGISFSEAAAPNLVGVTSWRMLKRIANLQKGDTILIVGAGGGVNSFCLQLAKHFGATVIALTSSEEKINKAAALGANHIIDYKKQPDWSREVRRLTANRGVDVVIDNVGAQTMLQSVHSVRRGGKIITVGNTSGPSVTLDNRLLFTKQISIIGSTMGSAEDFREVSELLWKGGVSVTIDRELPLQDGAQGYKLLQEGKQFGKIVLLP